MDNMEIYVLCQSRSVKLALRFLDACLPARVPITDEYPFPEYVDNPSEVFQTPEELMCQLEKNTNEGYSIYWGNLECNGPRQAMLFYTVSGAMIAGIGDPSAGVVETLKCIANQVDGRFGYITGESCPRTTSEEFISICRNSTLTCLFEGEIRNAN